jgi:hypothetical protein
VVSQPVRAWTAGRISQIIIQEEADTIIILHALYADEQFGKSSVKGRIIIKCSDTDVY